MATSTVTICCYVVWSLFTKAYSSVDTVGYSFQTDSALDKNAEGVFLMDDVVFPKSVIYNITLYCVRPGRSVWIQVWRPIDQKALTYRLMGQVSLTTGAVPRYYQIILNTRDEMMFTEEGDRLAIYHDKQSSPVAYSFIQSTMTPVYRATPGSDVTMSVGTEISFLDFMFPYRFSVSVTFDTDVDRYLESGTRTVMAPTAKPTTLTTIPPMPVEKDNLTYVGNPLELRQSAMTNNARGVYVLRHAHFRRGVVVSFFGYFVRKAAVWFQIWRPVKSGDITRYMLVGQLRAVPEFFPRRQEFKLNMGEYIFTEEGDVLGILVEGDINPIGFRWIYEQSDRKPLGSRPEVNDSERFYPGQIITFSSVELPYDFAIGALYDTDLNEDKYGTSPAIVTTTTTISTTTTTTTTTTTIDLVRAPSIGEKTIRPARRSLKNDTRKTFLVSDAKFPVRAILTTFYAYFANPGRVELQVWRRLNSTSFTLVGRKPFEASRAGYAEIELDPEDEIYVEQADCLGYYNDDPAVGAIGYHFEASNLFYNDEDFDFVIGQSMTFQEMLYPYRFAIAASYKPVVPTAPPVTTPSVPQTPDDNKNRCPPYCPEQTQLVDERYSWLLDRQLLLGFLIWLIVLTVMFLIVCVLVMKVRKSNKKLLVRHRPYSFTNPVTSSFSRYDRMMKEDDIGNFFEVTLGANGKRDSDLSSSNGAAEEKKTNGRGYTRM